MISAATGAVALLLTSLVRDHGVEYVFAAGILAGALMRFVSRSVMTSFVNALAILIFLAQLPQLRDVPLYVYGLLALGLAIIYLLPRVTRAVPSPLVCIVVLTAIAIALHLPLRTVATWAPSPIACRASRCRTCPFTLDTLRIVLPGVVHRRMTRRAA